MTDGWTLWKIYQVLDDSIALLPPSWGGSKITIQALKDGNFKTTVSDLEEVIPWYMEWEIQY